MRHAEVVILIEPFFTGFSKRSGYSPFLPLFSRRLLPNHNKTYFASKKTDLHNREDHTRCLLEPDLELLHPDPRGHCISASGCWFLSCAVGGSSAWPVVVCDSRLRLIIGISWHESCWKVPSLPLASVLMTSQQFN